jgi:flavin reductase (DIM6/NTAB) family NADH-FMN oxidoreductase RutF
MSVSEDFQKEYRNNIGMFATGVTVVLAGNGDDVRGMTANAVTSVSLDPTLLLFCPQKSARISELCTKDGRFTVNILAADQEATSNHFAGADMAPSHGLVDWQEGEGVPRIDGAMASMACRVHDVLEGGDHWIVLGEVTAMHRGDNNDDPLLFFCGAYRNLADKND